MKDYSDLIKEAAEYLIRYEENQPMKDVLRDLILEVLHEGSSYEYRMNKGRTADDIVQEALDGL